MLTMDEYIVIDHVLPNYLQKEDLIKVKGEVYEVLNLIDTPEGFDVVVVDNYYETKTISIPDDKYVLLVATD
jgi:hypothetical protein